MNIQTQFLKHLLAGEGNEALQVWVEAEKPYLDLYLWFEFCLKYTKISESTSDLLSSFYKIEIVLLISFHVWKYITHSQGSRQ